MLNPVPPSDCTGAREAASARVDGELSELGGARLDAHLAECAGCRRYAAEIGATAELLRTAALAQPPVARFLPRRQRRIALVPAARAAAILLVVGSAFGIGGLLGQHGSQGRHVVTTVTSANRALDPITLALLRRGQRPAVPVRITGNTFAV
jgi:predicted anti-sigma-YlaC factor YlaD